jgi:hypothetical protein
VTGFDDQSAPTVPPPQFGASQSAGYWLASDGNWYPPEQRPGVTPPAPGYQPYQSYQPYQPYQGVGSAQASNGLAIASLVLGIVSLVLFWAFGLSLFIGGLAVVLGAVGLSKSNSMPNRTGRGQAIAGIITGGLGAAAGILVIIGLMAAGGDLTEINSDPSDGYCNEDRWLQDPDC